eukprot:1160798-Pelagomonas_calceolata.AAC.5
MQRVRIKCSLNVMQQKACWNAGPPSGRRFVLPGAACSAACGQARFEHVNKGYLLSIAGLDFSMLGTQREKKKRIMKAEEALPTSSKEKDTNWLNFEP